jgi:hypothetical protein
VAIVSRGSCIIRLTSRNVSLVNHFIFVKSYGSLDIDSGSEMRTVVEMRKE